MNVLEVNSLSKVYKNYGSELNRILSWFGIVRKCVQEHEVIGQISFNMQEGEAIGLIGRNGAGKSTLLKMIAGTVKPSSGNIKVIGKVSAILELGMGFKQDFSGYQNARNSLGMMGFTQTEIDSAIPAIKEFSELGDYFNQPVRTYSSGMQMRLAFAIATAYRPDILIIDEALSVGDTYFQHKSFSRILEFKNKGTSVLFVSHDKAVVLKLCTRAILLNDGHLYQDGPPESIMDLYNALLSKTDNMTVEQTINSYGMTETTSGTGEASVVSIILRNKDGVPVDLVDVGEEVILTVKIKINMFIEKLVFGYMIKDRLGQTIFGETSNDHDIIISRANAGGIYEFNINFHTSFGAGSYSISTALARGSSHVDGNIQWKDLALIFNVVNISKKEFIGMNWIDTDIRMRELKSV